MSPMRETFAGRRVLIVGGRPQGFVDHIDHLRSFGVEEIFLLATEGQGVGPPPDVPTLVLEPPEGLSMMATMHQSNRVRVMPFLEGVPCSVHGIVLPDGTAALRPVELVTLRRGTDLVYAGCATFWDPSRKYVGGCATWRAELASYSALGSVSGAPSPSTESLVNRASDRPN